MRHHTQNIFVKANKTQNKYFNKIKKDILELHIAHNDGNYFCSKDDLKSMQDNDQIAVRYCNINGEISDNSNPNGSLQNIAGILNENKNVLGMMPHPERAAEMVHGCEDGKNIFESILN